MYANWQEFYNYMNKPNWNKQFTITKKQWWQNTGEEMMRFYKLKGKYIFWIFYKFPRLNIERAWHIAQKENDKDLTHLLANINS